jgi:hypothetical protein
MSQVFWRQRQSPVSEMSRVNIMMMYKVQKLDHTLSRVEVMRTMML